MKLLYKNNTLIEFSLNKILRKINKQFKTKFEGLIKEVLSAEFSAGMIHIFDFFQDLLNETEQ